MQKANPVKDKSYTFALSVISFCRKLADQKEYVLSRQLLKSGTSIGANIEEALQAQSTLDFISKLSISLKEARETEYWLRLLRDSQYATKDDIQRLLNQLDEIISLLVSIIKTSKSTLVS